MPTARGPGVGGKSLGEDWLSRWPGCGRCSVWRYGEETNLGTSSRMPYGLGKLYWEGEKWEGEGLTVGETLGESRSDPAYPPDGRLLTSKLCALSSFNLGRPRFLWGTSLHES